MRKKYKILLFAFCAIIFGSTSTLLGIHPYLPNSLQENELVEDSTTQLFPQKNTRQETYEDLNKEYPLDLPDPDNVSTVIEYDAANNLYWFRTKVGDMDITSPFVMTEDEYRLYNLQESMREYWKEKRQSETIKQTEQNSLTNLQFGIGEADKVFGPGGVQIKTQGSAELLFGFKVNRIKNPTFSERMQNPNPLFDFDEKIQLNVNGKVGDKVNFTMNYNTEASFDFDQTKIKLAYEGKEDDIVKNLEAGNVSLPLNSSLISGSSSLFGIKTELQFGKLSVSAIATQQETETKTVSMKRGAQTTAFEIDADSYDENRHFFLSHYFRNNFEKGMSKLPYVNSGVVINRIEVWITNKRGNFEKARNILAFMDLAETGEIDNTHWIADVNATYPSNKANSLYEEITGLTNIRNIQQSNSVMSATYSGLDIDGGEDYEKIESARLLDASEYTLNSSLGYISLKSALNADEVLAVAFEYTMGGKVYQVGEFSTDIAAPNTLILKLLKSTSFSPNVRNWDLMMKNVYYIGALQLQQDKFTLNINYQNDSSGVYLNYLPEGKIKNQQLLRVLGLDRINVRKEPYADGVFDFIEGYTIQSSSGRIIFPVLEPFGSSLRKAIDNDAIAEKYVFQELYVLSLTEARELSEKNKFKLVGQYKSSSGSEIRLNAMNIPQGSVKVTAGGTILTENADYTVDYSMGTVTILNQAILESGANIDVSLESQSFFSTSKKSLLGTHLEYKFSKDFSVGATILHLSETPLTNKVNFGQEPISNTIWGVNSSYRTESQWLTNAIDKLPLIKVTVPSTISANMEFAQLIPGHSSKIAPLSYLDDFESTKIGIDIRYPYTWKLSSTPLARFPEASLSNNIDYGKNRALIAWYTIDPIFTRNSNYTPDHIRNDKEMLSNHYIREIPEKEIFPNRDALYMESGFLSVLNLSYYPKERGPYNLDATNINPDGSLANPASRWGGIMRKLETTDFESANIEYIEFWMLDPFIYNSNAPGGDLYFNLGEISEDILKDGKKSFENGLPSGSDISQTTETVWGRLPTTQSVVNAFDNDANSRQYQDVGLDGLRTEDEFSFDTYKNFLDNYLTKVAPQYLDSLQNSKFSVVNDPAGDNYHYYRGSDYDKDKVSILERYKYYNGVDGNSPSSNQTIESYSTAGSSLPDVEDINQDNTLNEYEKYFEYKVSLRPADMIVGKNHITDKVTSTVLLKNGNKETVSWYQFKIPIREYDSYLSIRDFKSIRFIRMYMTGFQDETHLRFASLELVRGDWRIYTKDLYNIDNPPATQGKIDISTVNIEENSDKKPVNYILPPNVEREQDPSQPQYRQQNEQSMVMRVYDLSPGDARGVYKNISYDMRQYKRLQMFVHGEKLIEDYTDLNNSELTVFIRIGSDQRNNYYEYEIPLQLTPSGMYGDNITNRYIVWPAENTFDFPLEVLTNTKLKRNNAKNIDGSTVTFTTPYSVYDPEKPRNKITVVGNPNLGDIQTIMIGVRNQSRLPKMGEVWVNELRLSEFNQEGGWAALGNLAMNLSDLGSVNMSGRVETAGFGGIEQTVLDRRTDNLYQYNVSTALELGKLFPEKAKVRMPMFYSYAQESLMPKYDPLSQDLLLEDVLNEAQTQAERDSIKAYARTAITSKSFNLTNVKVDVRSKTPMPYDPANFSLGYSYTESNEQSPVIDRNINKNYRATFNYNYAITPEPWEPFKNSTAFKAPEWKIIKDINFNYLPSLISFSSNINRDYSELQYRNLETNPTEEIPLSFSKDFTWDRKFDIKYDLSRALRFSFSSATNSYVEEIADIPVNKDLFKDEYEQWKDTVINSLMKGGTPVLYQQTFNASYTLPINKIPLFDWITANGQYNSSYTWDKGVNVAADENYGNTITSLGSWQIDGRFSMEQLYNKSNYLRQVNNRFSSRNVPQKTAFTARKYEQTSTLKKGIKTKIQHRLGSESVKVTALDANNKEYKLNYSIIDRNNIEITPKEDTNTLKINITTYDPNDIKGLEYALQFTSRLLMMLRNVSFSYRESNGMGISGFRPSNGFLGQYNYNNALAPGYLFAFGIQEPDFLEKAKDNGWLLYNDIIVPASKSYSSDLDIRASLEIIPGLKVDVNAKRTMADQRQTLYQYNDMPTTFSGNFNMTTIAIGTIFDKIESADMNYTSKPYQRFIANRAIVASRLEQQYTGKIYPSTGFMQGSPLAGDTFDPTIGTFSENAADVMIPAFLAAYTNTSVDGKLNLIPTIMQILPNWRIAYDGLSRIQFVKDNFRNITLNHNYICQYNIGAYSSYSNWSGYDDGYGFVQDVVSGNPIPSSQYDISSVSITERFNPLVSINATLKNSITAKVEYNKMRNLTLNLTSTQLIESSNDELVIGMGFRINDFNLVLKLKNEQQSTVKNDLNLRLDLSYKNMKSLIRKIDDEKATQATAGEEAFTLKFAADYVFSSRINLRLFYDQQVNTPIVSSSYPTSSTNFGFSIRFLLTR